MPDAMPCTMPGTLLLTTKCKRFHLLFFTSIISFLSKYSDRMPHKYKP